MHIICSDEAEDGIQVWSYVSPLMVAGCQLTPHEARSKVYVQPCLRGRAIS